MVRGRSVPMPPKTSRPMSVSGKPTSVRTRRSSGLLKCRSATSGGMVSTHSEPKCRPQFRVRDHLGLLCLDPLHSSSAPDADSAERGSGGSDVANGVLTVARGPRERWKATPGPSSWLTPCVEAPVYPSDKGAADGIPMLFRVGRMRLTARAVDSRVKTANPNQMAWTPSHGAVMAAPPRPALTPPMGGVLYMVYHFLSLCQAASQ